MGQEKRIKEIERLIRDTAKAGKGGYINLAKLEIVNNYKETVQKIEYSSYIDSADLHYFVSRQLFTRFIGEYAYFCAQQCMENYFKGLLKYLNCIPPNTHKLKDLLKLCKDKTTKESHPYIHTEEVQTTAEIYEPFYELARYPVQSIRPNDGKYMIMYPDGIYILDLFVLRMKELLPIKANAWNIFIDGHYSLEICKRNCPEFYNRFKENNINFETN